jgi:large repetitive protein
MRFRFIRVLALAAVLAAAFAGIARALDFDDEDPHPPHPEIGLVYHYEIGTHAGCLPHRVVILSGQLPPGLKLSQLNDHTALVDGVATEAGTFGVWLALRDCDNRSAETLFTFDVFARRFSIATTSLPSGGLGAPYSATLQTAGIDSNTTWEVASGSLPAGLTLSPAGVISGAPTAQGSSTFTVKATGVAKDFTGTRIDTRQLTLNVAALAASLSRPAAEVGVAFNASLVGSGGQGPYTFSVTGAPAGLNVSSDGTFSGRPQRAGTYTIGAQIVDASGATTNVQVRLVVRPRLAIRSTRLPGATDGRRYRAQLALRGGVGPFTWSASGLPSGVKLASRTGSVAGTPRSSGTFRVTVRVRDALGAVSKKTLSLTVR